MREVKYKAWHPIKKEMHTVYSINFFTETFCFYEGVTFGFSDTPLVQYTGLKDINGVEIYEGDVVTTTAMYAGNYGIKENYEIKFVGGAFVGVGEEEGFKFGLTGSFADLHKIEVVCSIHEKPELIS